MKFSYIIAVVSLGLLLSCASNEQTAEKGPKKTFEKAMELFEDEDYLEAKNLFDAIKLQYPASQYADDAQYYLGECNFEREKYILGSFNYSMLRKVYPNSPYYKDSFYKTGLCYYHLSPPFDRDQKHTKKGIKTFSEFQSIYSGDSLAKEANGYIQDLRNKLGRREYEIAELYMKLRSPHSALIYYDFVIDDYYDTKYYEDAVAGKVRALIITKKYDKALTAIDLYKRQFDDGKYIDEIKSLKRTIPENY